MCQSSLKRSPLERETADLLITKFHFTTVGSGEEERPTIASARARDKFETTGDMDPNERLLTENDADSSYNKAAGYLRTESTKEALVFYLDALDKYKRVYPKSENIKIGNCLIYIGVCYSNLNQYDSELEYKLNALEVFGALNVKDDARMAFCLNNVGIAYGNQNDQENSLKYYLKALEMYKRLNIVREKKKIFCFSQHV